MRKQTKLVAVLSTAALRAIGASMTSFAAQGWAEEDGTWVYYNKDGEKATESWKKSGDNWYWLDDNGEMAVDMLVEDDDNYYYVNENGAMVTNQWVAIENEDAGEDDEPDHYWYYFQANGKAYKKSDSSSSISKKTINGKKYAFDEDGKMLFGWVDDSGERQTDDDAWQECNYYFGDEDDGAMSIGWRLISITADDTDDVQPGDDYWDEDQDRWFWFKSSGAKQTSKMNKKINGKKYGFDQYGRMVASWYNSVGAASVTTATSGKADKGYGQGNSSYSGDFMYFSSPEDGARYTKGWFKVVPGYYLHEEKYDEDSEYWYYADGDGEIYAGTIEKIKGKKYAFDGYGRMLDGLRILDLEADGKTINSSDDFDDEDDFDETVGIDGDATLTFTESAGGTAIFYFGNGDDGAMKTGRQTVDLDGENFTFKFETSSTIKGHGINGVDDKKLYIGGKLIKADKDDKYMVVSYDETTGEYEELKISDLKGDPYAEKTDKDKNAWKIDKDVDVDKLLLINSSGSISTKNGAKDGDDYKFYFTENADGDKVLSYITLDK